MNTPSRLLRVAVFNLITAVSLTCADAAQKSQLRYQANAPTNVFKVLIEVRGENGKEALAGNIVVSTRQISSNVIGLTLRGNLIPKRDMSGGVPYMGMGRGPRWQMPVSLAEGSEIWFDAQGRILRVSGDYPLPFPLGTVAQLFVSSLPGKTETKWESVEEASVADEPLGLGPTKGFGYPQSFGMSYGYMPGNPRNVSAVVIVTQRIKSEVINTTATTTTIHKKLSFDSPLMIGSEPRISASGEGDWVFDHVGGFLRSAEIDFQALLNTESSTRRTTSKLKIELLEGKEREAALMPMMGRPILDATTGQYVPRKLTGDALEQVFADLRSGDESKRQAAAARLQSSELVAPPQALVDYMTNHLFSSNTTLKMAATKVIGEFGSKEHVPELLRILKSSDSFNRHSVIAALGRLKDPRAIEPLVACIAKGDSDSHSASTALGNFGPEAEDAVLTLLKENHNDSKRAACDILEKIGTQKSLEPLKELVTNADQFLSNNAGEALRAIQARQ